MTDLQPISPFRESVLELVSTYKQSPNVIPPESVQDIEDYLEFLRLVADVIDATNDTGGAEEKHLANRHDQQSHAGLHSSSGDRVYTRRSSMASILKGKRLQGKTVKSVFKTSDSRVRQVLFTDGSRKKVPSAILSKIAYGPGSKSEVGKLFPSTQSLRRSGFVSYAQANYLYNENRTAFYKVMSLAKSGQRYWDAKQQKMVTKRTE